MIVGGMLVFLGLIWLAAIFFDPHYNQNMILGVSFDPENAGSLHLDPQAAFHTVITDWKFKYVRLPVHWDKVEPARGVFNFNELDYYMNEAVKNDVRVTLAIGSKTPRWPECPLPTWARSLSEADYNAAVSDYIRAAVIHFQNHPALEIWQVDNEPFLSFGSCPKINPTQLKVNELGLVKSLDPRHPTLVTDSGELSSWSDTASLGDYFGTTLYRVVWDSRFGYWTYDWLPAAFYRIKLWLAGRRPADAFISELQAEPWAPNMALVDTLYTVQQKSMSLDRLKKNIDYAHHVGFARAYLWGAEWWCWLKASGHNEIPDYIATLNR